MVREDRADLHLLADSTLNAVRYHHEVGGALLLRDSLHWPTSCGHASSCRLLMIGVVTGQPSDLPDLNPAEELWSLHIRPTDLIRSSQDCCTPLSHITLMNDVGFLWPLNLMFETRALNVVYQM